MSNKKWNVRVEAVGYIGKVTAASEDEARAAALCAYGEEMPRGENFATWAIFEDDEFSVSPAYSPSSCPACGVWAGAVPGPSHEGTTMKLSNAIRDSIIEQAMDKAFSARDKAHDKATAALADAAYAHQYGAIEKLANKLPQGWCNTSTSILIECGGFAQYNRSERKNANLRMSKQRRIIYNQYCHPVKIGGDHPLFDQAQAVADEYQAINRDKDELRAKLRAVVYAATTVEKLLAAWPECEKFLPATTPKPAGALVPVELVPELNAALGLKAKARKTA